MRGLKCVCGLTLICMLLGLTMNAKAEERWYLRVIARNDTPEAQEEKLRVRDAALNACPLTENELFSALPDIKKAAESVAPCRVEIKRWSPDKKIPPALTLYITIGEGWGHNYWGALYADSLLMAKAGDIPEEPERVEFVWPVWNWILSLFGL